MNSTKCRYCTESTLGWMLNNKIIVILSLLSFCLFVSTLAIAGQRNRAYAEIEYLKNAATPATQETTPTPEQTTGDVTTENGDETTTENAPDDSTTTPPDTTEIPEENEDKTTAAEGIEQNESSDSRLESENQQDFPSLADSKLLSMLASS